MKAAPRALLATAAAVGGGSAAGVFLGPAAAVFAGIGAGIGTLACLPGGTPGGEATGAHPLAAGRGGRRRAELARELARLEDVLDLQRGVFEASAELVGCVDEADARRRFAGALRRYWSFAAAELLLWERGSWRALGGGEHGEPPELAAPVQLPAEDGGDLALDLSPAVDGRAALVLRRARPQPALAGYGEAEQRHIAEVLRGQLTLSLRRVVLYSGLQSLARTDPLTGSHRRWYGEERLRELVDSGAVVAVAMLDIDRFKQVNDQQGHAAGDRVLAAVGGLLTRTLRSGDLACRWGGEEFLIILPDTSPAGAALAAERLRAAVAALADLPVAVTVSAGTAACLQDDDAEALVARADQALYRAKTDGRNRVESALVEEGVAVRTAARRRRRHATTASFTADDAAQRAAQRRPE